MKPRIVVIGGGHAGVEAAVAAASRGAETVLITPDPGKIALMSCNPSIGGIAKGTLVKETDGLGGVIALSTDRAAIQFRMLNMKKGQAVWGPRVQADLGIYCLQQRRRLEEAGVIIHTGVVSSLVGPSEKIQGVLLQSGETVRADGFVIATGTFLRGILHRGSKSWPGGRRGDISANRLEKDLRERMFHVKRFKTGTSPRVLRKSVDTSVLEEQSTHEMGFRFSMLSEEPVKNREKCWVTRTTGETEEIVRQSLRHSPLYSGRITGKGPRYCPSFEDKVTKFPDRTGHPIHLEPMGIGSRIMYLNGLSTSLPEEIQERTVRSIRGFENAVIAAYGYSVEYTCFETGQFTETLRVRGTGNLYAAGQILGTSGYEEAAAAGLLAGANAAASAMGLAEQVPHRLNSYLGVMVDDLVHQGAEEPYRLFSSRSENRLYLRQDNAHRRMYSLGQSLGTLTAEALSIQKRKDEDYWRFRELMRKTRIQGNTVEDLCKRPEIDAEWVSRKLLPGESLDMDVLRSAILDMKYSGYIKRSERKHRSRERYASVSLDGIKDFSQINSLSIEAAQSMNAKRPSNIGEAERIPGVRQADIEAIVLSLMKGDVSRETS